MQHRDLLSTAETQPALSWATAQAPPLLLSTCLALALSFSPPPAHASDTEPAAPDLLSFSQGTLPLSVGGDADALRLGLETALWLIDGDDTNRVLTRKPATPDYRLELTFELPAETRFTHFAVPNVQETPSPSQTFAASVKVLGASDGPDGPWVALGETLLQAHDGDNERTEFVALDLPVRWLRLELSGGLDVQRELTFIEFSELQGFGSQADSPLNTGFSGSWRGRGVRLALNQDGALVEGCYDHFGELKGTVNGRMLFASGVDSKDGVRSAFVLTVEETGELTGLRSTNGAPFRPYAGSPDETLEMPCQATAQHGLGCGDTVYGLQFAFDSAQLLPASDPVLAALADGLKAEADEQASPDATGTIVIEGHSSSEGTTEYNLALSKRRAEAVVAALIDRGIKAERLAATGFGESQPVADNNTEAGRALNRRVTVSCSTP